jgi:phage-related protein
MSNLIVTDAQDLEISSSIVELFEITIGAVPDGATADTNILYFHAEKDLTASTVSKDLVFNGKTYVTIPIEMEDIEKKTGGVMNRPKLTIANVESLLVFGSSFKTQMQDGSWNATVDKDSITANNFKLDDLIGQRITRRKTLEKYTGSATAYEFDSETFIFDRISAKTLISCEFELASPADIGGVRVPNRQVIGKYCPWVYQGYQAGLSKSACSWATNQQRTIGDETYDFYFTKDDEPLVFADYFPSGASTTAWKRAYSAGAFSAGEYVSHKSEYTSAVVSTHATGSSISVNLTGSNTDIQPGFEITASSGIPSGTTVVRIAGTNVVASAAISVSANQVITFKSPLTYYRAESDMTSSEVITPIARSSKWRVVRPYTNWSASSTYTPNTTDPRRSPYVRHANTIWRVLQPNTGITPGTDNRVWTRGDVCGKLLESCKIRYQATPKITTAANMPNGIPDSEVDTTKVLPFGGFPGSRKFR